MPDKQILDYIESARDQGIADEAIQDALFKAGWRHDEVIEALAPMPSHPKAPPAPPAPATHFGMWVGFLYILFFISLYVLSTSIGGLLHEWANHLFPVINLSSYSYSSSTGNTFNDFLIKGYVAGLIVSYPVFAVLAKLLKAQTEKHPAVKNLRSRKILIYITLIGTFIIMLSELIKFIFSFLSNFLLTLPNTFAHLIVTLAVCGAIFGYFIMEVIHDSNGENA